MPPTIHLVRHAQGFHNLSVENETMHDPDLTPLGEEQCAALRSAFTHHDKVRVLAASPLRRTLHTCRLGFAPREGEPDPKGLYPIVALDVLQEVSASPCDTGSPVARIAAEFGERVDLARVDDATWTDKESESSRFVPTVAKLTARAAEGRRILRDLATKAAKEAGDEDVHVVAVAHGGFLHFLTDDWADIPEGKGMLTRSLTY